MDSLQRIKAEKYKGIKTNSVLRLTPMILQEPEAEYKQERQIDEIRKKLKLLCHMSSDINVEDNFKENNYKSYKKSGDLLSILLGHVKNVKKSICSIRRSDKNNVKSIEEFNQIVCSVSSIKHRKIKTQIKSPDKDRNSKYLKQNPAGKQQSYKQKEESKTNVNMQKYLIIKSQKAMRNEKPFKKIRISEQLRFLKKQPNRALISQNIIIEKEQNIGQFQKADQIKTISFQQKQCSDFQSINQNKKSINPSNKPQQSPSKIIRGQSVMQINKIKKTSQFRVKKGRKKTSQIQQMYVYKYRDFINFIALLNNLSLKQFVHPYKFYIGKGNNDDLPRKLLKKRKWIQTNKLQQANFVWTQRKQQNYYKLMQKISYQTAVKQIKNKNQYNFVMICQCSAQKKQCFCSYSKLIKSSQLKDIDYANEQMNNKILKKLCFKDPQLNQIKNEKLRIHNHFVYHHEIAYKKLLFKNLKQYYQSKGMNTFQNIPLTFHIQKIGCDQWTRFKKYYQTKGKEKKQNLWIIKPGSNTNRGTGITVQSQFSQIRNITTSMMKESLYGNSTVIIQQYIMPLLYNKRKFDIRCYVLATTIGSKFKAYWYEQGYIRTSSKIFSATNTQNKFIHLTNDAIQKNCMDYGKYEPANKVSFENLSKYIETNFPEKKFQFDIYPSMVKLSQDAFESSFQKLHNINKDICFEVFGLDFMIDQNLKVWLIQVNRNPCLQTNTSLLNRVITQMLDNAFKIAVDPILPPPNQVLNTMQKQNCDSFKQNKFRLIVDRQIKMENKNFQFIQSDSDQD